MKVSIKVDKNKIPINRNWFDAYKAFERYGYEINLYQDISELTDNDPENIVVGGFIDVEKRLEYLGLDTYLHGFDYPKELKKYLGREVTETTLGDCIDQRDIWIKPKYKAKVFKGKVLRDFKDIIELGHLDKDMIVYKSNTIDIISEWRAYILYGKIIDVKQYKGHWGNSVNMGFVCEVLDEMDYKPNSYSIDIGITVKGENFIVEVNDGHSLGNYGIYDTQYARMISARWAEMTNTTDYLKEI